MIKEWLHWITYTIVGLAILFLCLAFWYMWLRPSSIPPQKAIEEKAKLPERSFAQSQESYNLIGEPQFSLKTSPATLQLPDLKQQLNYFGKNNRPDAKVEQILLNFGFLSSNSTATIPPKEKLYITYDRKQKPPKFIFSPNNEPTTLWLEATPKDNNEVVVAIKMVDENGEIVQSPSKNATFSLREKDQTRGGKSWDIGNLRVDATLLSRQKARWYGQDLFLEKHGGEEYANTLGKERIDFLDEENPYSVFVREGDFLIWNNDRWQEVKPNEDTASYPLLVVKKISDRVMNLELWNVKGKGKANLNLLKSAEMKIPSGIQQSFKFVGAKTRSQFIFEINKERISLKPKDWLLLTKKGWVKLTTPEEIDDYVNRKTTGPLFVFDGLTKKGDAQLISGTIFNTSRTEMQHVELPVQQSRAITPKETVEEKSIQPKEQKEEYPERLPLPNLNERPIPPEIQKRRESKEMSNGKTL